MAKGDSPERLKQRREAQHRYLSKKNRNPEFLAKRRAYMREQYMIKHGHDQVRPAPTHCEVCGDEMQGRNVQWDHNHKTGKFRGWICGCCNRAIGQAKESAFRLRALAAYVERNE